MRMSRILIFVAIALLIGTVAGYFLIQRMNIVPWRPPVEVSDVPEEVDTKKVVFAVQEIPRGTLIQEEFLLMADFPADQVQESMFTDVAGVVGRYSRMDIPQGVPLTSNMLAEEVGALVAIGSDAAIAIPPGYTAISVPIDLLSSVAYALRDGDRVDVLVSMPLLDQDTEFQTVLPNLTGVFVTAGGGEEAVRFLTASANYSVSTLGRIEEEEVTGQLLYVLPSQPQQPRLVAQRLIENATVLHVGTFPTGVEIAAAAEATEEPSDEGIGAPSPGTEEEAETVEAPPPPPEPPKVVTLIMTPQDALTLYWATKSDVDIMLTLRGTADDTETLTTSVTLEFLLEQYSVAIPNKIPVRIGADSVTGPTVTEAQQ
jgi:pilus assembly protein CpaB